MMPVMLNVKHLITVADTYRRLESVEEKTVSSRVFSDSKKLAALRSGADITVGRFNDAMCWFSENWPRGKNWPSSVPRPVPARKRREAVA